MNFFKLILNKILYRERSDSDSYIRYLKKHGCKIGKGVKFYSPRTTTIDEVKQDWISIGDYTKITQGVIILAHDYSPSVCIHTHKKILLQGGGVYRNREKLLSWNELYNSTRKTCWE